MLAIFNFLPYLCLCHSDRVTQDCLTLKSTEELIMETSYYFRATKKMANIRIDMEARFSDPCKNGHNDFAFTANVWERKPRTKRFRWACGGCCHEEIAKYFPEVAKFLPLHLNDGKGRPMYYVANSLYWLKEDMKKAASYMNVDEATAEAIKTDCETENVFSLSHEDKVLRFTEILNKYNIIEKWQSLANECLEWFKTNQKTA